MEGQGGEAQGVADPKKIRSMYKRCHNIDPPIFQTTNTNWKLTAGELRRDLLQRLQNALKDNQVLIL
jgi:hypothetical protein